MPAVLGCCGTSCCVVFVELSGKVLAAGASLCCARVLEAPRGLAHSRHAGVLLGCFAA